MDVGLFDQRGIEYESPGFRGVFGAESSEFFVSARHATRSFTPGRIKPGKWTVIVPVFDTTGPTEIKVRVTLYFGSQGETKLPGPEIGVVNPNPGWYKASSTATRPNPPTPGPRVARSRPRAGPTRRARSGWISFL